MSLICATLPKFKQSSARPWPIACHLQIAFIQKGSLDLIEEDQTTHQLSEGSWFVVKPARSLYHFKTHAETALHWIEFDEVASQSLMGFSNSLHTKLIKPDTPYLAIGSSSGKLQLLGSEISKLTGSDSRERMLAEAKTLEWLALLLDHPVFSPCKLVVPHTNDRDELALDAAKRILETRLDESHSLAKISREVHLNEFKLKKGFRERFGRTVFGYLRQKRMEHAHELLKSGNVSIIEVANSVGYSNASHFARAFKEAFGFNPSELTR